MTSESIDDCCNNILELYETVWLKRPNLPTGTEIHAIITDYKELTITLALVKLSSYGCILDIGMGAYQLQQRGYEIIAFGGWNKNLSHEVEKRTLTIENIKVSIESTKASKRSGKVSVRVAMAAVFVALCGVGVQVAQYFIESSQDALSKQAMQKTEQLNIQILKTKQALYTINSRLDSLSLPHDTLK